MTIIERLEEKVTRQENKVARETEKLAAYKEQLETAMFATFKRRQSISHMSFEEALDHALVEKDNSMILNLERMK